MSFSRLLDCLVSRRRLRSTSRTFRPSFDKLEERSLMATFTVDDDFTDNPAQRRFDTIQEAVNAASAGDTINVRSGTYEENVLVNKRLTIQSSGGGVRPVVDPVDDGAAATPAYGFNLQANDIVIKGFRIGETDNVTDPDGTVGINTSNAFSGYKIRDNIIENNVFGIYLNSSTASNAKLTEVTDNKIQNNNTGLNVLPAAGNGIYSDQGLRNVHIHRNSITGHQNASIILVGGPASVQSHVKIFHNDIRVGPVILANVTNSEITHNAFLASIGSGIFLAGGCSKLSINHNVLASGAFTGINLRFDNVNFNVTTANTNIQIVNNVVSGFGDAGIRLRDGTNNITVKNNVVSNNGSAGGGLGGISLENADNNRIENNTVRNNRDFGIRLDALSTGNVVTKNTAKDNSVFDYVDETTPPPLTSPPTQNTWTKNKGKTQNRPGLFS